MFTCVGPALCLSVFYRPAKAFVPFSVAFFLSRSLVDFLFLLKWAPVRQQALKQQKHKFHPEQRLQSRARTALIRRRREKKNKANMGHCMTLPLICCFPFFFSSPCLACHSARWCLCASASVCVCLCRDNGNEINHIHETTTKKKKAANEKSVAVEHKKLVRQRAFLRAQKVP